MRVTLTEGVMLRLSVFSPLGVKVRVTGSLGLNDLEELADADLLALADALTDKL